MSGKDVRERMSAAAKRQPAQSAAERPKSAEPPTKPYKGTFELPRPEARQLRLAALQHDLSITRLLEAAALLVLEDEALLARAVERAQRLASERA